MRTKWVVGTLVGMGIVAAAGLAVASVHSFSGNRMNFAVQIGRCKTEQAVPTRTIQILGGSVNGKDIVRCWFGPPPAPPTPAAEVNCSFALTQSPKFNCELLCLGPTGTPAGTVTGTVTVIYRDLSNSGASGVKLIGSVGTEGTMSFEAAPDGTTAKSDNGK